MTQETLNKIHGLPQEDMKDRITKFTTIKEAKKILESHGYILGHGWALVMGTLLEGCDYIIVKGYGNKCYFEKHTMEDGKHESNS